MALMAIRARTSEFLTWFHIKFKIAHPCLKVIMAKREAEIIFSDLSFCSMCLKHIIARSIKSELTLFSKNVSVLP